MLSVGLRLSVLLSLGQWVTHQQALGDRAAPTVALSACGPVLTAHLALLSRTEIFEFVGNPYLSTVRLFTHVFTTFTPLQNTCKTISVKDMAPSKGDQNQGAQHMGESGRQPTGEPSPRSKQTLQRSSSACAG